MLLGHWEAALLVSWAGRGSLGVLVWLVWGCSGFGGFGVGFFPFQSISAENLLSSFGFIVVPLGGISTMISGILGGTNWYE